MLFFSAGLRAQTLCNNGQQIWLDAGAVVFIDGNLNNLAGEITIAETDGSASQLTINGDLLNNDEINGQGVINLYGNWLNNSVFNAFPGTVNLQSANHTLEGSQSTHFNNLNLNVDGVKTLGISQFVSGILNLGGSEINTQTHTLTIENTHAASLVFTYGFISSSEGGYLCRRMQSTEEYIFPLGNDYENPVFRPVSITPSVAETAEFNCRFANVDPDTEGYYTSLLGDSIDFVNPAFFHVIGRSMGTTAVSLKISYSPADGDFDHLANWNTTPSPAWQLINESYLIEMVEANYMSCTGFNNFANPNFILCDKTEPPIDTTPEPEEDIIVYNSFSPNGDNLNDTWIVENCEDCHVTVYNRNGNLVFISEDNSLNWDGTFKNTKVPDATYYYIIDTKTTEGILKGSVTIIR